VSNAGINFFTHGSVQRKAYMSIGNKTGMSDISDKERVLEAVDLVELINDYVPLQQKGREWVGLCPFHDDHKPSLHVVTHKGREFYKCFSCQTTGDCFDFIQNYLKKDFFESLCFIAERVGVELSGNHSNEGVSSRGKISRAMQWAATLYSEALAKTQDGKNALQQLHERGFTDEIIDKFSIGVAPDSWTFLTNKLDGNKERIETGIEAGLLKKNEEKNRVYDAFRHRIMFPIFDESDEPIAFGGRRLHEEDEPKYINSPETVVFHKSKTLYGYNFARDAIRKSNKTIVVEGYTDVIACHQAGITNVVATLGTALTSSHADKLSRMCNEVILIFDGDTAGQLAANRAIEVFFNKNIDVHICVLPEGKDPADLATKPEEFNMCISNAVDTLTFKFNRLDAALHNENTIAGKSKLMESFLDELIRLGIDQLTTSRKSLLYEKIASLLHIPMKEVDKELRSRRGAPPRKEQHQEVQQEPVAQSATIPRARQLAEHEFLAILLFNPTESSAALRETNATLSESDFIDPLSVTIARFILPKLLAGTLFTMSDITSQLDEQSVNLATSLYFVGERICETYESVSLALTMTMDAFSNALEKQAIENEIKNVGNVVNPEEKTLAAQRAIEAIRRRQATRRSL